MNQKQIGIIAIVLGFIIAGAFYMIKLQQDQIALDFTHLNNGSCVTPEGVCLHERSNLIFIVGLIFGIFLLALGFYLLYFDKTQQTLAHHQREVSSALKEAKHSEKFEAFLAGFTDEEKKALKAIKEQDGIQQSTLRYRTGISKASLSLMLKRFEEKGIITRKEEGKTNKVFLRKVY
jgi:uncharacterized membrane protein